MKTEKKKELLIAGLVTPWAIVFILLFAVYASKSSLDEKSKTLEELTSDKKELIERGNEASAELRNSKVDLDEAKAELAKLRKKLAAMPPLSIFQRSWRVKRGNVYLTLTLNQSNDQLRLIENFSDGGVREIIVELEKKDGDTYLRPIPRAESGDFYVIKGKRLMCLDKMGAVYIADEE